MDGRVIGNAIEPEHLVKAETQQNFHVRSLLAPFGLAGDEPIEGFLPATDPVNELLAERAIDRRNPRLRQFALENIFDKCRFGLPQLKHADGNFSWFLNSHA